jgi:oxygen-independent coproporphyrinogen-3 oxidase
MYEATEDMLADAGYEHYEISNWARPNPPTPLPVSGSEAPVSPARFGEVLGERSAPLYACQHNLVYWCNEPYLGLGAAAHSSLHGWRFARIVDPAAYIAAEPAARIAFSEAIDRSLEMAETAILGLRLLTGLSCRRFHHRFGVGPLALYRQPLLQAQDEGLVALTAGSIYLTRRGRLLSNEVFERLLPEKTEDRR